MKILRIEKIFGQVGKLSLFLSVLLLTESMMFARDEICDPDLSIENQKAKKISADARILLAKVVKDKVTLVWPVEVCKCWVSSLFGPRKSGFHNGIDLAAPKTTPVYAAADGIVEVAQMSSDVKGYGNMILIEHKKLKFYDDYDHEMYYKTRYAHLDSLMVEEGQKIKAGRQIGTVGATGHVVAKNSKSDPSHLHFEVYRGSGRINPLIPLFAADEDWIHSNL